MHAASLITRGGPRAKAAVAIDVYVDKTQSQRGRDPITGRKALRKVGLLCAAVAAVTLCTVGAAFAASPNGQTVTETDHVHGTFYEPAATNPCNGDTLNGGQGALFDGNLVNHVTYFTNSDEVWATFTETGSVTGTDDVTGVSYSGHATAWGNFNMNERNQTSAFTLTIHLSGSDGSSITAHDTAVFTMNANGTVTVNFDKFSLSCG